MPPAEKPRNEPPADPPRRPRPDRTSRDAALAVIEALRAAGHTALLAGGCVRDMLLGRPPKDYDVVTDAPPPRVLDVFPRARRVGAQFGVVLVRRYRHDVEVATFRTDGDYSDGRHPDAVEFGTAEQDAARRDFTINGMFYDPVTEQVIDYVAGQADLAAGVVRTIGVAEQRFGEDHLRMLRAVRFAATLGFEIADETRAAIAQHAGKLAVISAERVQQELERILTDAGRARGWALLTEVGLRPCLSPSWPVDAEADALAGARLAALPSRPIPLPLATAAALADVSAQRVRAVSNGLRWSNSLLDAVGWLVAALPRARTPASLELADVKDLRAHAQWPNLLELLAADLQARGQTSPAYDELCARAGAIPADRVHPPPLLGGHDVMDMGVPAGPRLGEVLRGLYRAQLNEELTTVEEARAWVQRALAQP